MAKKKIGIVGGKPKKKPAVKKVYKEFETVEEVMNEEFCNQSIRDNMHDVIVKRRELGKNSEIKRSVFNQLKEKGYWTLDKMKSEFLEIWYKRSNLSGAMRDYITAIVNPALEKTILYYQKPEKK